MTAAATFVLNQHLFVILSQCTHTGLDYVAAYSTVVVEWDCSWTQDREQTMNTTGSYQHGCIIHQLVLGLTTKQKHQK